MSSSKGLSVRLATIALGTVLVILIGALYALVGLAVWAVWRLL
jgi:hypothetical protein